MVEIYYGDGKGKTTAAMGLAIRFAGHGGRVILFQFMKDNSSGERNVLEIIKNITTVKGKDEMKFSFLMTEEEREAAASYYHEKLATVFSLAKDIKEKNDEPTETKKIEHKTEIIFQNSEVDSQSDQKNNNCNTLIILDEVLNAVKENFINENELIHMINELTDEYEVVLTGRSASLQLIENADYVTEFKEIKHPYEKGVIAREKVEY